MGKSTVIFDGECNLCNGLVSWLLKSNTSNTFHFVPFQSHNGQQLLIRHGLRTDTLETVILLDESGIHTLSDGFIKIIAKVPKWQKIAWILSLPPKFIRDKCYKIAAKNRVLWFGKSSYCTITL